MRQRTRLIRSPNDGVWTDDNDGAYYNISQEAVQLVIKGPMHLRPGDYEPLVSELVSKPMILQNQSFLPVEMTDADGPKPIVAMRIGFISLIFVPFKVGDDT